MFGFAGAVGNDGADLDNARALGNSLLFCWLVPFFCCFMFYTGAARLEARRLAQEAFLMEYGSCFIFLHAVLLAPNILVIRHARQDALSEEMFRHANLAHALSPTPCTSGLPCLARAYTAPLV